MGISWTDEQKSVINSRHGNLLVSAAAGSGKTAVLVERILEMVMGIDADGRKTEAKIDIDEVLVVTFTRAAAAQMKEKIADKLEQAAEEHPEDEHIVKQLSLLPRAVHLLYFLMAESAISFASSRISAASSLASARI